MATEELLFLQLCTPNIKLLGHPIGAGKFQEGPPVARNGTCKLNNCCELHPPWQLQKEFSSDFVRLQIMRDFNVHSRVLSDPNVGSPPKQLVLPQWLPSEKT